MTLVRFAFEEKFLQWSVLSGPVHEKPKIFMQKLVIIYKIGGMTRLHLTRRDQKNSQGSTTCQGPNLACYPILVQALRQSLGLVSHHHIHI